MNITDDYIGISLRKNNKYFSYAKLSEMKVAQSYSERLRIEFDGSKSYKITLDFEPFSLIGAIVVAANRSAEKVVELEQEIRSLRAQLSKLQPSIE